MPIHEFKCEYGHITEKLFLTFTEAENVESIACTECYQTATKIISVPGQAILLGEGFYKPSPSGNTHYKRSDPTQFVNDTIESAGGKKNLAKEMKKK